MPDDARFTPGKVRDFPRVVVTTGVHGIDSEQLGRIPPSIGESTGDTPSRLEKASLGKNVENGILPSSPYFQPFGFGYGFAFMRLGDFTTTTT